MRAAARCLAAATLIACSGAPGAARTVAVAPTAPPTGPFRVVGNTILNAASKPFYPHGVDRPSLEWSCVGQGVDGAPGIPGSDFQLMSHTWHANVVRLALNQDSWLSSMGWSVAVPCPDYQDTVRAAVNAAEHAGLAVILDLHVSDRGDPKSPAKQQPMADVDSLAFWRSVAAQFASDPQVMFELYNEPQDVSWDVWRDGGDLGAGPGQYRAVGMQTLVDAIRAAGATNIVIAGGRHFASDLAGLTDPSRRLRGTNIAYAVHPYEAISGDSTDAWEEQFGRLASAVPVIATEFGTMRPGVVPYDEAILRFLARRGIGYSAWAWWAGGPTFPSLLADQSGRCINGGCITQRDLALLASGARRMTVPVPDSDPARSYLPAP